MPLKHSTETLLLVLLGIATIIAGVACELIPALPGGALAWLIVFVISLAYPIALYPLFKKSRADYEFRALHFAPAFMLGIWFLLQLGSLYVPAIALVTKAYVWGWAFPVVAAVFVGMAWFSLHVLRQSRVRLTYLLLMFVPFFAFAAAGEHFGLPQQIASLWTPHTTGSGVIIAGNTSSTTSSNLSHSENSNEEKLRAALRRMERRKKRLAELQNQPTLIHSATDGVQIAAGSDLQGLIASNGSGKTPPHLPSSGFGTEVLFVAMLAGYCALLQRRAMLRM